MKKFITLAFVAIAFGALVSVPADGQVKIDKKPAGDLTSVDPASRGVKLINDLRAKKGTPKLKPSASLDKIAQRYAAQLASKDQPIFKDQHGEIEPLGSDRIPQTSSVLTDWHGQFGVQAGQKDPAAAQV